MQILINIFNLTQIIDIIVDTNKNLFLLGDKKISIDTNNFANNLISIISSWKNEMINDSIIDGEHYSITIKENNVTTKYIGRNSFPPNYSTFKNLILGVLNEAN